MATMPQHQSPAASNGPASLTSHTDVPHGVVAKEYYKFARGIPGIDVIELEAFCSEEKYWTYNKKFLVIIAGSTGSCRPDIGCFQAQGSAWSYSTLVGEKSVKADPSKLNEFLRTGSNTYWRFGLFDFSQNHSFENKEKLYVSLKLQPFTAWMLYYALHEDLGRFLLRKPNRFSEERRIFIRHCDEWEKQKSRDLLNPFQCPTQGVPFHTPDGIFIRTDFPNYGPEAICLVPYLTTFSVQSEPGIFGLQPQQPGGFSTSLDDIHCHFLELFLRLSLAKPVLLHENLFLKADNVDLPFLAMEWLDHELMDALGSIGGTHGEGQMEFTAKCGSGLLKCADTCQQAADGLQKLTVAAFPNRSSEVDSRINRQLESLRRQRDYYIGTAERIKQSLDFENLWISRQMAESTIHEAKFAKTVTVLAFIFLPVSIATSVFGMNIQQLNDSGKDVSTFIVTTVVLIVSTAILWATSIKFSRWRQRVMSRFSPYSYSWWGYARNEFLSDPLSWTSLQLELQILLFPIGWPIKQIVRFLLNLTSARRPAQDLALPEIESTTGS